MSTPSAENFVHLHVHTEYSMLDGAAKLGEVTKAAADEGMPALAMTDHGNVFGAYDFYKTAKAAGVKPIIGMEGYYTPGSRFDRAPFDFGDKLIDEEGDGGNNRGKAAYTHMTLLARTTEGMHNLFRISSLASLEGQYRKPRFDRDLLERYGKGLIATTGCPSGEVNMWLRAGKVDKARQAAADFQDIFGKDNFYAEIMDHGLSIEKKTKPALLEIAKELGIPLLGTNDLHYTHREDAQAHDALLCIQTGSRLNEPNRFKFNGDGYYLKSAAEMRALFREHPEACDNTLLIAEQCEVQFTEGADLMPRFPLPDGEDETSWFIKEVEAGLHKRYPAGIPDHVRKQADYEVGIITQMGFPGYFLVVADFINWAKDNGIRVGPGRGSAAGSMAAFAMGITDLDPLQHGLIFERFLNPERVSMPDVDIDFDDRRRGEVIRYVSEKYGEERVSQIVTYGTIKAKAAIKDAARVLDRPYSVGDELTKLMPPGVMGKDIPLSGIFDPKHERYKEAGEFRARYESDPGAAEVVDQARKLEGLKRQWGVHAAGVIIGRYPLIDSVPIMRREADGAVITQFDYPTCETLGLLKMDFLGLRNLTVIDDALRNIVINGKDPVDLDEISKDLTDKKTYELLGRGDTLGVFQFDGGPMRSLLRLMRPDNFEDISAVGALYRPGPMGANSHTNYALRKNGQQEITPIHPELAEPLEEILGQTYGLIVYQEQVMAIAQKVAGYSLGKADLLRRAMGKKKKSVLDAEYVGFEAGMKANGYSAAAVKTLWDILVPFADYAFNKAHSAAYGLVSYWTAYLKANYPAEYMAGLLTSVGDDKDRRPVYLAECRRMGIKVLPPDVNESSWDFTAVGTDIRFGMASVRNVGHNVVDSIVRAREEKGAFKDFADFMRKIDTVACNKKVIESLAKAGAFDSMGHSRQGIAAIHANAVDQAMGVKRKEAEGQFDLFGSFGETAEDPFGSSLDIAIPTADWSKSEKLVFERDMLGLYVSDHPLHGVEHVLTSHADTALAEIIAGGVEDGANVTIAGILTAVGPRTNKQGAPWAIATIEDLEAGLEVLFFPKTWAQVQDKVVRDQIVVVKGRISRRDDTPSLFASEVYVPEVTDGPRGPVLVSMPAARCTPPVVERLREVLGSHPGTTEVQLKLLNGGRETVLRLDQGLRVQPSTALMGDIKALLGPTSVALL
ncbi:MULTISPECIES: DNA polymerase III subunit alpha [unclassified Modestobacter]|uniref:DNA polymerase III subunit alpha n=1 Tax=unclassified Modestobacter TaxID=2643866 RepID=UPI0022AAD53E|nr:MULTISPECIES: DNA polymerase III subunit alpha [unclassified Modestobacter]MCZ2824847.1 DNA polymerase III subunit alpha [Modestobacter sp. VKM Ac-2981]MCZ2854650.1 DNA polymerase III subunit alpha [Modestobacter sp. VKM Ac-2982]